MPYYTDLDTVNGAAKLVADVSLDITGTSQGNFSHEHVKYQCILTCGNESFVTSYQSNPAYHGEPSVSDVLGSLVNDAADVAEMHIDDFADELGFTKPSQAIRAYEACQKALGWLRDGLGLGDVDIAKLSQTLDENAGAVEEAAKVIRGERARQEAFEHPKAPYGFVTIESLQAGLDLGDYGDQLVEYADSVEYISDAISEVADANVDFTYHDLLQWMPDNYEWIEEAYSQGLLESTKGDIFKMIQAGQYECFTQNLYDHQEDIAKYAALESLKTAGVYALSEDAAFGIDDIDFNSIDTFDELAAAAKEQVQEAMYSQLVDALGDDELAEEKAEELVDADDYATVNPAALSIEATREVNEKGYDAAFADCETWRDCMGRDDARDLASMAQESRDASSALGGDVGHGVPEQER